MSLTMMKAWGEEPHEALKMGRQKERWAGCG
jgi:hypothetical protein